MSWYPVSDCCRASSITVLVSRGWLTGCVLFCDPQADYVDYVGAFMSVEGVSCRDPVPAIETGAAARSSCVLSNEDRMPAVGRLTSIVSGLRRCQFLIDQGFGVFADRLYTAKIDDCPVPAPESKFCAKRLLLYAFDFRREVRITMIATAVI